MSTNTSNFSFIKPSVNDPIDQNLWGGYLNTNFDSIDSLFLSAPVTKTSSYSVLATDTTKKFIGDATSGNITFSLPAASTGLCYSFQKSDSSANTVIVDADGTDTINGEASYIITNQYGNVAVYSDGNEWFIVYLSQRKLINIQQFYTSATYTPTTGAVTADVMGFGAGGGGGGGGGSGSNGNVGSAGGDTTYTGHTLTLTASGGSGGGLGGSTSGANGAHGAATNGDSNITGGGSAGGNQGNPSSDNEAGGAGGYGGLFIKKNIDVTSGTAAIVIGAAGAGGAGGSGGGLAGQDGIQGKVIVYEYA